MANSGNGRFLHAAETVSPRVGSRRTSDARPYDTPHSALRATCLACGLGQVAALTAHRAVIHYRNLRFATLKGKA